MLSINFDKVESAVFHNSKIKVLNIDNGNIGKIYIQKCTDKYKVFIDHCKLSFKKFEDLHHFIHHLNNVKID